MKKHDIPLDAMMPELVELYVKSHDGKMIERNGMRYFIMDNEYYIFTGRTYERLPKTEEWLRRL